jgi:hypothetical protein
MTFSKPQPSVPTADEIFELEARLKELRARADAEKQRVRESVKPVMLYTAEKSGYTSFEGQLHDDIELIMISGTCTNVEELQAVGNRVPLTGGMKYYFHTADFYFIGSTGGGTSYSTSRKGFERIADKIRRATVAGWDGTEPLDITDLITTYRQPSRY